MVGGKGRVGRNGVRGKDREEEGKNRDENTCSVVCSVNYKIQRIVSKASSFDLLFSPTSCLKTKPKPTESGICM